MRIVDKLIQYRIKRTHRKNGCIFHIGSQIDESTVLEGRNLLGQDTEVTHSIIGFASYLGRNCIINRVQMGRYCSVGPNVSNISGTHPSRSFVSTHPTFFSLQKQVGFTYACNQLFEEYQYVDSKNEYLNRIGNDVWIGQNVTILQGVSIGDGAIVGAGAIVTKDVEPYSIVGGVPAKTIGWRFSEEDISFLLDLKWWDNDEEWIRANADCFADINVLKKRIESL